MYMGQASDCQCETVSAIRESDTLSSLISIRNIKFISLLQTRMSCSIQTLQSKSSRSG